MDLSKKEMLYINGCSHSLGSEIEREEVVERTAINLRWCFGGQLAHKYSLRDVNDSYPGGSNDRIYRTSIDWLTKYIYSGRDVSKLFCIFGWTADERIEFFYNDHWYQVADGLYIDKSNKNLYRFFKTMIMYTTDDKGGMIRRVINIITMSSFLKEYNIDYVMLNAWNNQWEELFEERGIAHLKYIFPFDHYFEPYGGFVNQYINRYKDHFTKWYHADKFIHTLYAEKLDKFIREEL